MISNRFIAETLSGADEKQDKERVKLREKQKKYRERAVREAAMKGKASSSPHPNLNAPGASK